MPIREDGVPRPGWHARLMGFLWATAMRIFFSSWRKRCVGMEPVDAAKAAGQKMMLCFWHGKYVPIIVLMYWQWIALRGQTAVVFTSRSKRGEIIAEICRRFGLECVLIPDLGQRRSYALMKAALARHDYGVVAVDGPLGPARKVKQGALRLASELRYALVPVSVFAERKKVMEKRWDAMEFPYPFSRVGLAVGDLIPVPDDLDREGVRVVSEALIGALDEAEIQAAALLGHRLADPSSRRG